MARRKPGRTPPPPSRPLKTTAHARIPGKSGRADKEKIGEALSLARRLRDEGHFDKALDACRAGVKIDVKNPDVHFMAGTVLMCMGEAERAAKAFNQALRNAPSKAAGLAGMADYLAGIDEIPQSLDLFARALKEEPDNVAIHRRRAEVLIRAGRIAEAHDHYHAVAQRTDAFLDLLAEGASLERLARHDEAIAAYRKALATGHQGEVPATLIARLLVALGEREQAASELQSALAANPDYPQAHLLRVATFATPADAPRLLGDIDAICARLGNDANTMTAAPLHFARARLHALAGDMAAAAKAFTTANGLVAGRAEANEEATAGWVRLARQNFTSELYDKAAGWGDDSTSPIFVFGLPRSGHEFIASRLSEATGAVNLGEVNALDWTAHYFRLGLKEDRVKTAAACYRKAWPADIDHTTPVIDASPGSYLRIGLIALIFPNARLVHCERLPSENALAIHTNIYDMPAYGYAAALETIASHMRLKNDIMAHWQGLFPGRILTVRHEDLTANPQHTLSRIAADLGLEGDFTDSPPAPDPVDLAALAGEISDVPVLFDALDQRYRHSAADG